MSTSTNILEAILNRTSTKFSITLERDFKEEVSSRFEKGENFHFSHGEEKLVCFISEIRKNTREVCFKCKALVVETKDNVTGEEKPTHTVCYNPQSGYFNFDLI